MTELVSGRGVEVSSACRLFGRSRQAYYRLRACGMKPSLSERSILEKVEAIRSEAPGIGCRKLWLMLCSVFGRERMPGRDRFFRLLRRRGLVLACPKPRRTTDSNHRYHKWKNLVRGFTPTTANQLWVADITYIPLRPRGAVLLRRLHRRAAATRHIGEHDRGLQPHRQRRGRARQRHNKAGGRKPPPRFRRHRHGRRGHRQVHRLLQHAQAPHEHRQQHPGDGARRERRTKTAVEKEKNGGPWRK